MSEITNTLDYSDNASLWNERRCELALEYVAWTDFVRRAYYDQSALLKFMGNQQRNYSYTYSYTSNTFEWSEDKVGSKEEQTPTADRLTLPYPESELIMNPLLKEAPVAYEFEE